jgi:hypothetical protein
LNWTEPAHDGNIPISAYEPGCKRNSLDPFRSKTVSSDVFSAEIKCAVIDKPSQNRSLVLYLLLTVIAKNELGSTSSELLDLTVGVRAAKNNQSDIEVFVLPPTLVSTLPTTSSTKQIPNFTAQITLVAASSSNNAHITDTLSLITTSEAKSESSAVFHPTAQFVSIREYNKTSYKEKPGSTSDDKKLLYGIAAMVLPVVISVSAGIAACRRRRYALNLKKRPQDQGLPLMYSIMQ